MSRPKVRAVAVLRLDPYRILADCVERGTELGWHRAHKHTTSPDPETIKERIAEAIMNEIADAMLADE